MTCEKDPIEKIQTWQSAFNSVNDAVWILSREKRILYANRAAEIFFGLSAAEMIGKQCREILSCEETRGEACPVQFAEYYRARGKREIEIGNEWFQVTADPITNGDGGPLGFIYFARHITITKEAEKALRTAEHQYHMLFEKRTEELWKAHKNLKKKTEKLEDVNTTIRVLLEKREVDQEENEEKITLNVKELMLPYIEKLKNGPLTENQKRYVGFLESGLKEIISPFTQKLTSRHMKITSRELQIANLVKAGKTSREIAEILCVTERTVVFHRANLRKKLGLGKKANLRTYLLTLQSKTPSSLWPPF